MLLDELIPRTSLLDMGVGLTHLWRPLLSGLIAALNTYKTTDRS